MSGRGRRPDAELAAIRERVEQLMLQGLRSPAIQRALTGPEAPHPLVVSERQVREHMAAVERAWRARGARAPRGRVRQGGRGRRGDRPHGHRPLDAERPLERRRRLSQRRHQGTGAPGPPARPLRASPHGAQQARPWPPRDQRDRPPRTGSRQPRGGPAPPGPGSRAAERSVRHCRWIAESGEARFEPGRRDRAEQLARPIRSTREKTIVSPTVILAAAVLASVIIWTARSVRNGPRPPLSHHQ